MSKVIKFIYNGKEVDCEVSSTIKREELYGKQVKTIEKDGEKLTKGTLTPSGELFPSSAFGSVKIDSGGSLVESPTAKTPDGKEAPIFTSSFKEAREIKEVDVKEVADLAVEGVIPITQTALEEGFYATEYTYRDSTKLQNAVLVVKADKESFLLVGDKKETPLLGKLETYEFFDSDSEQEAEESEEVDFSMF